MLGIGFSMLAGAAVPAHTSAATNPPTTTPSGEIEGFEVSEHSLNDTGLQSTHEFQGEEQGEF